MKWLSTGHVQIMYPAEYYLTTLPQKESLKELLSIRNHPNLMPYLYKDLGETNNKQGNHSSKQNDSDNSDIATHNYNLHSRIAHRL